VPPGSHRRIKVVRAGLDELKLVKDAFGTTVNDVVLAVVTGALAYFLQSRGRRTEGIELKACIPVSVRSDDHTGTLGNQLTQIMAPLPVFLDDPLARLQYVKEAMDGIKESRQALAASAIASLQDFAPPTLHAQASRLNFAGRFFNLLVTNVPGPQFPLYVLGRRLSEIFPIPFLAGERALAIAIMSYDGKVGFGLLGDYDALPDLAVVAEGIEASLAQLVSLADG
jgi:WS/DGAT/MGAT family acyltransferase